MKNNKSIIIIILVIVIISMSVAYSEFATQLKISGETEITGEWDVKITGIVAQDISDGCDPGEPKFTNTTAQFNAKLQKPGDKISYVITIKNEGTINAILDNETYISDEEEGSPAIKYSNTSPSTTLDAGTQTTFTITVMYDENVEEVPEIKKKTFSAIIEYAQK